jgi:hypothetical protein
MSVGSDSQMGRDSLPERSARAQVLDILGAQWRRLQRLLEPLWGRTLTDLLPWMGILALSVASFVTTLLGMNHYTDKAAVAFFGTLGIQVLMIFASGGIGQLPNFRTSKFWWLATAFAIAMSISSFFSFAAFYEAIETEDRRVSESDTLIRNEWTRVFNDVRVQATYEFAARVAGLRSSGNDPFQRWRSSYEKVLAQGERFVREFEPVVEGRLRRRNPTERSSDLAANLDTQLRDAQRDLDVRLRDQDSAREKVAILKVEVASADKLHKDEIETGGTKTGDRTVTPAGDGPVARKYLEELRLKQAELRTAELKLVEAEVRVQTMQQRVQRLEEDRLNLLGTDRETELLAKLEGAQSSLKVLTETLRAFRPVTTTLDANSVDQIINTGQQISDATSSCITAKEHFRSAAAALDAANISVGSIASFGILDAGCDTAPRFGDGGTVTDHVASLANFLRDCPPNSVPASASAQAGPAGSASSAETLYQQNFTALANYLRTCLAKSPVIRSTEALETIMGNFQRLLLTYNPKAHPFTRAIAAFQRRDYTAYLAAGIAFAIDFMILVCGLAMRRAEDDEEMLPEDMDDSEAQFEQEVEDFLVINRNLLRLLIVAMAEVTGDVDGTVETAYECAFPRQDLEVRRNDLAVMHDMGLLTLHPGGIAMRRDQYERLRRFAVDFGL